MDEDCAKFKPSVMPELLRLLAGVELSKEHFDIMFNTPTLQPNESGVRTLAARDMLFWRLAELQDPLCAYNGDITRSAAIEALLSRERSASISSNDLLQLVSSIPSAPPIDEFSKMQMSDGLMRVISSRRILREMRGEYIHEHYSVRVARYPYTLIRDRAECRMRQPVANIDGASYTATLIVRRCADARTTVPIVQSGKKKDQASVNGKALQYPGAVIGFAIGESDLYYSWSPEIRSYVAENEADRGDLLRISQIVNDLYGLRLHISAMRPMNASIFGNGCAATPSIVAPNMVATLDSTVAPQIAASGATTGYQLARMYEFTAISEVAEDHPEFNQGAFMSGEMSTYAATFGSIPFKQTLIVVPKVLIQGYPTMHKFILGTPWMRSFTKMNLHDYVMHFPEDVLVLNSAGAVRIARRAKKDGAKCTMM